MELTFFTMPETQMSKLRLYVMGPPLRPFFQYYVLMPSEKKEGKKGVPSLSQLRSDQECTPCIISIDDDMYYKRTRKPFAPRIVKGETLCGHPNVLSD